MFGNSFFLLINNFYWSLQSPSPAVVYIHEWVLYMPVSIFGSSRSVFLWTFEEGIGFGFCET